MTGQPLDGLRVVELAEGIAGPYAGKLLADYGADVVKVEPPGGDRTRAWGPFPDGDDGPEQSALFLHLNTNKRSIVAEPGERRGRRSHPVGRPRHPVETRRRTRRSCGPTTRASSSSRSPPSG